MREQAGLTLADLARKSGYSIGTINGLELHGEGSRRLKDKLREILTPLPSIQESVTQGRSSSVKPGVEFRESPRDLHTVPQCKQRIAELESEVARLWAMIEASRPRGISYRSSRVNSGPASDEAALLDDVEKHAGGSAKP